MIVLGIETSTPQTSVALGTTQGVLASSVLATGRPNHEVVVPALHHLLEWAEIDAAHLAGVAVGLGPGLFTGLRVGVQTGKSLAQALRLPILGLSSLDVLAFGSRYTHRVIAAVIDARRGEVFFGFYRQVPGGVARERGFMVGPPDHLAAEVQAFREEVLLVGNGAILYRRELEELGGQVEFASSAHAFPHASALVELAAPRLEREESDRLFEVAPLYLRKSDAEIAWDQRSRAG